jgi:hypothetical protein
VFGGRIDRVRNGGVRQLTEGESFPGIAHVIDDGALGSDISDADLIFWIGAATVLDGIHQNLPKSAGHIFLLSRRQVRPQLAQELQKPVKVVKVKQAKLKAGSAILIAYTSNSAPNPVTNKQIRLEHDRYLFYKDGKVATLDMAAPQGADNVDDWLLMANSLRWK